MVRNGPKRVPVHVFASCGVVFLRFSHAVFILVCTLYSWYSKLHQNALALSISSMLLVGFAKSTARYFVREAYTLIKIKTDEQIGSPVRK